MYPSPCRPNGAGKETSRSNRVTNIGFAAAELLDGLRPSHVVLGRGGGHQKDLRIGIGYLVVLHQCLLQDPKNSSLCFCM